MPDLFAHFASGYLPSRHPLVRRYDGLLVIGCVLPDILTSIPGLLLDLFLGLPVVCFFEALHTPVGFGLFCYVLAMLFEEKERKWVLINLWAGSLIHFLLDLLQRQFYHGIYKPFFPFSNETVQWSWFHYNDSLFLSPLLLILMVWAYRKVDLSVKDWQRERV